MYTNFKAIKGTVPATGQVEHLFNILDQTGTINITNTESGAHLEVVVKVGMKFCVLLSGLNKRHVYAIVYLEKDGVVQPRPVLLTATPGGVLGEVLWTEDVTNWVGDTLQQRAFILLEWKASGVATTPPTTQPKTTATTKIKKRMVGDCIKIITGTLVAHSHTEKLFRLLAKTKCIESHPLTNGDRTIPIERNAIFYMINAGYNLRHVYYKDTSTEVPVYHRLKVVDGKVVMGGEHVTTLPKALLKARWVAETAVPNKPAEVGSETLSIPAGMTPDPTAQAAISDYFNKWTDLAAIRQGGVSNDPTSPYPNEGTIMYSNLKVIKGTLPKTGEAYNLLKILDETAQFRVTLSHGSVPEEHVVPISPGSRFFVQMGAHAKRHVWGLIYPAVGQAAILLRLVQKDNCATLDQSGDVDFPQTTPEAAQALLNNVIESSFLELVWEPKYAAKASDVSADADQRHQYLAFGTLQPSFDHPRNADFDGDELSPGQDVTFIRGYTDKRANHYTLMADSHAAWLRVNALDKGLWLDAVVDYIDNLVFDYLGQMVKVCRVVYTDGVVGARIVVTHSGDHTPHYLILNKALVSMVPTHRVDVFTVEEGDTVSITLTERAPDAVKKEETVAVKQPQPTIPSREWIPQLNQYVHIEGDEKKTLYVIADYDQYENKFMLVLADSCRRQREQDLEDHGGGRNRGGLGERGDKGLKAVEPGRLRPMTLRY